MASSRSYKCEEKDSFSRLPEELQDMILQLVSVQDLENCLRVSKHWNEIANRNGLWKRHCLAHGITPEKVETFEEDCNSTLCKGAQIWLKFRNSPSYGWQTCKSNSLEIDREENSYTVTDGKYVAFCRECDLIVWDISQLGKIKYTIVPPFTLNKKSNVGVHELYIAIAKGNIMVFYKLMNSQYEPILAIAISEGVIIQAFNNITSFVIRNYIEDFPSILIRGFKNSCLWMGETVGSRTYIVNLIDYTVSPVESYAIRCFANTYVVSWRRNKLQVDDYFGRLVIKLTKVVERAVANDKLLLTFSRNIGHELNLLMETWNLSTSERHLCFPCPEFEFIELHPSRNILIRIDPVRICITAMSAITGEELWTSKMPSVFDIFDWGLKIICEKYLVLFQFKCYCERNKNKLYVYDVDSGQFLYETYRPLGYLNHLSDNLIVTLTSTKLFMRIFSNVDN